ncbi:tRNA synthetases class I (M)-domain-containing protein [Dipodascopsis uninucleata]
MKPLSLRFVEYRGLSCFLSRSRNCGFSSYRTVCQSDLNRAAKDEKAFYVTTPIFYVNAAPHIGHLYSMMLADTLKRWKTLTGRDAYLLTGTDEHGMKVQQVAEERNIVPKELCDETSQIFRRLASAANISLNRFIRTTDADHAIAVKEIWNILQDRGYIYKGKHEGWYCVSDETFYPKTQIKKIVNKSTKKTVHVSRDTGKTVEWTSEENYYFALSKMQKPLLQFYEDNREFVVPESRYNEMLTQIEEGLPDISISRPSSRSTWGIPVPGDDSQTVYVWLDALINYLTATGYPWKDDNKLKGLWPADVHIIGKDITRFHCIFWPAFLLAAGLPLPEKVLVHAHWLMNGSKMSKSLGNVVDPFEIMNTLEPDAVRYYLMCQNVLDSDGDFSVEAATSRRHTEIVNKFGNLIGRICGKKFSIENSVKEHFKNPNPKVDRSPEYLSVEKHLKEVISCIYDSLSRRLDKFDVTGAMLDIWSLIGLANKYVEEGEPWKTSEVNVAPTIYNTAEAARVSAILLQPFLPEYAERALNKLNVHHDRRTVEYATYGADDSYGHGSNSGSKGHIFNVIK